MKIEDFKKGSRVKVVTLYKGVKFYISGIVTKRLIKKHTLYVRTRLGNSLKIDSDTIIRRS